MYKLILFLILSLWITWVEQTIINFKVYVYNAWVNITTFLFYTINFIHSTIFIEVFDLNVMNMLKVNIAVWIVFGNKLARDKVGGNAQNIVRFCSTIISAGDQVSLW